MFPFSGGINGDAYNDEWEFNGPDSQKGNFTPDPLYYHTRIYIDIEHETERAYLLSDDKGKYWIPKALIKIEGGNCYQFNKFKIKYLEEK